VVKIFCKFLNEIRLLATCGTYKTSFTTIDGSEIIFSYLHMGILLPFTIVISYSLVVLACMSWRALEMESCGL